MRVTWLDAAGLVGVVMMLVAYALTIAGRLDAMRAPALLLNLIGSVLVLASLYGAFNLSSAAIEAAWAIIALGGLVRLARRH